MLSVTGVFGIVTFGMYFLPLQSHPRMMFYEFEASVSTTKPYDSKYDVFVNIVLPRPFFMPCVVKLLYVRVCCLANRPITACVTLRSGIPAHEPSEKVSTYLLICRL